MASHFLAPFKVGTIIRDYVCISCGDHFWMFLVEAKKLNVNRNTGETILHKAARLGYHVSTKNPFDYCTSFFDQRSYVEYAQEDQSRLTLRQFPRPKFLRKNKKQLLSRRGVEIEIAKDVCKISRLIRSDTMNPSCF